MYLNWLFYKSIKKKQTKNDLIKMGKKGQYKLREEIQMFNIERHLNLQVIRKIQIQMRALLFTH